MSDNEQEIQEIKSRTQGEEQGAEQEIAKKLKAEQARILGQLRGEKTKISQTNTGQASSEETSADESGELEAGESRRIYEENQMQQYAEKQKLAQGRMPILQRADPVSGIDPLYGQNPDELTEHDRRQYEEFQERNLQAANRFAQEQARRGALEHAVFASSQQSEVQDAAREVKAPSFFFYFIWYVFAAIVDVLDYVELFVGYAGGITAVIAGFFAALMTAVSYIASGHIKRISSRTEVIQAHADQLHAKVTAMRQRYAKALRTLRKTKTGAKFARKIVKVEGVLKKSPLGKAIAATIANIIPILDLVPWQLYGVYTTHKAHKRAHQDALASITAYENAAAIEADEFTEEQINQYEEILAQTGEDDEDYES